MKISQNGLNLIKSFEGCRLSAYKCPAGVWTIGYGHTGGVKSGQTITKEKADDYLVSDLQRFENHVAKYDSKYHWNQNQFDALVSFAYNIGNIDQLTANGTRTIQQISEKITSYNKANGAELAGLTRRRKAEKDLFDTPVKETSQSTEKTKAKNTLKKGGKVKIKSGATDANTGKKYASFVYKNTYKVHSVGNGYVVFGDGKTATGKTKKENVKVQ